MDKKSRGLADDQQGDFILNESGTSVNIDNVEENAPPLEQPEDIKSKTDKEPALRPGNE